MRRNDVEEIAARLLNVGWSAVDLLGRQAVHRRDTLDERRFTLKESGLLLRGIG